jgi:hypothetical protein
MIKNIYKFILNSKIDVKTLIWILCYSTVKVNDNDATDANYNDLFTNNLIEI